MSFPVHQMTYQGAKMHSDQVLRNYRDEDYEQYASLYNEAFAPMRRALGIEPIACCADRETLLRNRQNLYVLEEEGEIRGSVGLFSGEIDDLVVGKEHRRKGYGKNLLSFAVSRLQKDGISPITLHVADWNKPAIQLYLKNGFVLTKTEMIHREG